MRLIFRLFVLALPCVALPGLAASVPDMDAATRVYIVLKDQPVAAYTGGVPGYAATRRSKNGLAGFKYSAIQRYQHYLENQQSAVEKHLSAIGLKSAVRERFTLLTNTIVAEISNPQALFAIDAMPEVQAVFPESHYRPLLDVSNPLMGLPEAWTSLGGIQNAGEGVKIGIIDSGIDVTHPMFSGEGFSYPQGFPKGNTDFTNEKVIAAYVFPPDGINNDGIYTPRDLDGHGTHVAACAAGNANTPTPLGFSISGVAPRAWIGNYNIFSAEDATDAQLLAALDAAALDGMDIVNLSLGTEFLEEPDFHPVLQAIRSLTAMGIVVVSAAGNDGHSGEATVNFPAQAPDALAVGSLQNGHEPLEIADPRILDVSFSLGAALATDLAPAFLALNDAPILHPMRGTFSVVSADYLLDGILGEPIDASACVPLPTDAAIGSWVLITDGDGISCPLNDRILNVENTGAVGAIVMPLTEEAYEDYSLSGTSIPVLSIDGVIGAELWSFFGSGTDITLHSSGPGLEVGETTPFLIAEQSSNGPGPDGNIKPEIIAIGQGSYAATQDDFTNGAGTGNKFNASGFAFADGTSFAAPRVTGAAALIKQAHPDWNAYQIRSALIGGAVLEDAFADESVTIRGAGHVDIQQALDAPFLLNPPILSFGIDDSDTEVFEVTRTVEITSVSNETLTIQLDDEISLNSEFAAIEFVSSQVQVAPGEKIQVELKLTVEALSQGVERTTEGVIHFAAAGQDRDVPLYFFNTVRGVDPVSEEARILVVDDDDGKNFDLYVLDDFDLLEYETAVWDIDLEERYPEANFLRKFDVVVWYLGGNTLNNVPKDEIVHVSRQRIIWNNALVDYLDNGGSLLLAGQDYTDSLIFDTGSVQEQYLFTHQALHLENVEIDALDDIAMVAPAGDGRLGLDFSESLLSFPFTPYVDELIPETETTVVRPEIVDASQLDAIVGYSVLTSRYRVLFYAFPILALDDVPRLELLGKSTEWLLANDPYPLQITGVIPQPSTAYPNGFTLTIHGTGIAMPGTWEIEVGSRQLASVTWTKEGELIGQATSSFAPGSYDVIIRSPGGLETTAPGILTISEGGEVSDVADWKRHAY